MDNVDIESIHEALTEAGFNNISNFQLACGFRATGKWTVREDIALSGFWDLVFDKITQQHRQRLTELKDSINKTCVRLLKNVHDGMARNALGQLLDIYQLELDKLRDLEDEWLDGQWLFYHFNTAVSKTPGTISG